MTYQLLTDGSAALILPPKRKAAKKRTKAEPGIAQLKAMAESLGCELKKREVTLTGKLDKCWVKWGKQARTRR